MYKIKKAEFTVVFNENGEAQIASNSTNFPNMSVGPVSGICSGGWAVTVSNTFNGNIYLKTGAVSSTRGIIIWYI